MILQNNQGIDIKHWHNLFLIVGICLLLLTSCTDKKSFGPIGANPNIPNFTHPGVFIVNEGGFTFGQASLSYYDFVEDSMYNQIFQGINNRSLGDVLQSMSFYKGKAYLVLNNSQKIEVVDSATFKSVATITGLNSPRQVIGHQNKLFVSDLYSSQLIVLDATTYSELASIATYGWTNDMLIHGDKLFTTVQQIFIDNTPTSKKGVLVIDVNSLDSIGFIDLVQGANSLLLDKNEKVWVLCDGGLEEEIGGLFRIDPISLNVEVEIPLPSIEHAAGQFQMNQAKDKLYFTLSDIDEGINAYDIFEMDINATALPDEIYFDGGQTYIYGFLLNEQRNEFYINDAVGLIQEGFFMRYDMLEKKLIQQYETGIFPSSMYVKD